VHGVNERDVMSVRDSSLWTTPKLVVLARSAPEEDVLHGCKSAAMQSGSGGTAMACNKEKMPGCRRCNAFVTT